MSQRGTGYNNPAFSNQFESSLYDYEYIPEIDPDSPVLDRNTYRLSRQIAPQWAQKIGNNSSSDESHGSIVVEERNNRIVTTIYEKRPKVRQDEDGGYVHDISLESTDSNNDDMTISQTKHIYKPYTRHRYEELEIPTYNQHRYAEIDEKLENEGVHFTMRKPRAPSPISYKQSSPIKFISNNFNNYQTSSPVDDLEMLDFSPPLYEFNQRQPPVGAPTNHDLEGSKKMNNIKKQRIQNPEIFHRSPMKPMDEKKKLLTPSNSVKIIRSISEKGPKLSARRNISSAFAPEPKQSPYRPTTEVISNRNTAIITPILQKKFGELTNKGNNFQNLSRMFKSTGNLRDKAHQVHPQNNFNMVADRHVTLKRKQSVPNFHVEARTPNKTRPEVKALESPLNTAFRKLEYQSPTKSSEKFSPLNKSRLSLLETMQTSFTTDDEGYTTASSGCLLLAAVVQLLTGMVTCGIAFYLLSKLGRQYYLDLAVLAGFVSMVLGVLGLRSHRWKWLPNRNYISSYVVLAGFSILNTSCLVLIIAVRPMSHDPFLNVCAGAICAVSVIIIGLSIAGMTMSDCCKSPPPDSRVTSV